VRRAATLAAALALLSAGCDIGDEERAGSEPRKAASPPPAAGAEERAIRAWSTALNEGDYEAAATYFAQGALVEQTRALRLPDRKAAVAFNRSLPCKADLTDIERESDTVLAAFRLRDGPGGPCEGGARVRFRFRDGKFAEWRQLAQPAPPEGPAA
jgi:hypothetical protein